LVLVQIGNPNMRTLKIFLFVLVASLVAAQESVPPASVPEVSAGVRRDRYISPYTLSNHLAVLGVTSGGATNSNFILRQNGFGTNTFLKEPEFLRSTSTNSGFYIKSPYVSLITTNSGIQTESQGVVGDTNIPPNVYRISSTGVNGPGLYGSSSFTDDFPQISFNHCGDGVWYNGLLIIPMQMWHGCGNSSNQAIASWTASHLVAYNQNQTNSLTIVSNIFAGLDVSSLDVDEENGLLWVSSFCTNRLYAFDLEDMLNNTATLVRTVQPNIDIPHIQGIAVTNGRAYLSAGTPPLAQIYVVDLTPGYEENSAIVAYESLFDGSVGELEGITIVTNAIWWDVSQNIARIVIMSFDDDVVVGIDPLGQVIGLGTTTVESTPNDERDLIVYLPFLERTGTIIRDYSTNSYVFNSASTIHTNLGALGQGVYLDGTTNIPSQLTTAIQNISNLTAMAWVKKTGSGSMAIMQKHSGGTNGTFFLNTPSDTSLNFTTINESGTRVDLSETVANLVDGKWHHVAGTYDGVNMRLWFDGVCIDSASQSGAIKEYNVVPLTIGGNGPWVGFIDEVRLYSRAVTTNEIVQFYNERQPDIDFGSLVSDDSLEGLMYYQPFTELSGTNLLEYSTNRYATTVTTSGNVHTNNGVLGNGGYFDGATRVTNDSTSDLSGFTNITIMAWFQKWADTNMALMQKHSGGTNGEFFLLAQANTNFQFTTINTEGNRVQLDSPVLASTADRRWHHVAGTYDGTTMRLWYDGEMVASSTNQTGVIQNNLGVPFTVGGNGPWYGLIDEVRVYNRALDTNEITRLFNFRPPRQLHLDNIVATNGSIENLTSTSVTAGTVVSDETYAGNLLSTEEVINNFYGWFQNDTNFNPTINGVFWTNLTYTTQILPVASNATNYTLSMLERDYQIVWGNNTNLHLTVSDVVTNRSVLLWVDCRTSSVPTTLSFAGNYRTNSQMILTVTNGTSREYSIRSILGVDDTNVVITAGDFYPN
jgi:hypothetical protein